MTYKSYQYYKRYDTERYRYNKDIICSICNQRSVVSYLRCCICESIACYKCVDCSIPRIIKYPYWNIVTRKPKYSLFVCHLCTSKSFLIKLTSPVHYPSLSEYDKKIQRITVPTTININLQNQATCPICRYKVPILKTEFLKIKIHKKRDVNEKCEGSRKICLEVQKSLKVR